MIIREFKKEDRSSFLSLCNEFYSSHATIKSYNEKTTNDTFDHVLEQHENLWGYLFCDQDNGKPIGYALVTSYWCNEEGGNVLVLDELFISPTSRHHGYGNQFMAWLEQRFRGKAVAVTLEVLTTNQAACSLYQKDGMTPDGFTTMTKPLSDK